MSTDIHSKNYNKAQTYFNVFSILNANDSSRLQWLIFKSIIRRLSYWCILYSKLDLPKKPLNLYRIWVGKICFFLYFIKD